MANDIEIMSNTAIMSQQKQVFCHGVLLQIGYVQLWDN